MAQALKLDRRQLGENLPYIRWFLSHMGQAQPLLDAALAVYDAVGWKAHWEAFKVFGDLLMDVIDDFPMEILTQRRRLGAPVMAAAADIDQLEGELRGRPDGTFIKILFENLDKIMALIQFFISLKTGGV